MGSRVPATEEVRSKMSSSEYSGQLLLQHSDLGQQYRDGFRELREAEELLDVTLACEDDTLDVHKVVMSASSPFFRKVLSKTKQSHPFIYMKGIKFEYLKVIVDFVYKGEAFIVAEELDNFLEAAQELQITGLATDEDEQRKVEKSEKPNTREKVESEELVLELENFDFELKEKKEFKQEKEEMLTKTHMEADLKPLKYNAFNDKQDIKINIDEDTLRELKDEVENNMKTETNTEGGKITKCKICGKEFKKRNKASEHVETHLDKFSFPCEFCGRSLNTRRGLKSHIVYNHTKKKNDESVSE